ncbi:biosynthetic-type acetolactate synthase large subunit [Garciella nitratireducens]|uniref:biosynthetic-type acetolactate synthase large subunit n=1 Tax=Garciella nitratireducens TaxID=218205 RepID=UPI001BD3E69E|nr:biosynthetic-type acetolactate synthase large subunit [Garciella nitratireducens]
MVLSGAEIVLECLKEQGVKTIFGYPGGAMLPLYDALYKYKKDFTHILTSHEQGATHAADGYARASGKVGVCFTTSGPGATNAVTGIATAYMDSIPMVVFTGQVGTSLLGKDSFQEVDITAITIPITKHNYIVRDIKDLSSTIKKAFKIAQSDRPGPVLVDIPKDVLKDTLEFLEETDIVVNTLKEEYSIQKLIKAMEWIDAAKQPVIYAGGGVISSNASQELYQFAIKENIPVVNSLMGLGSFPRDHKLSLGMVGMHGLYEANMAVTNSDLVIAIGARFSDRVVGDAKKFAKNARIIHVDIDQAEISKNKDANLWLIGDIKKILTVFIKNAKFKKHDKWGNKIEQWKKKQIKKEVGSFHPQKIIECAYEVVKGDAIVTTEVGQHQMWVAQTWQFQKPRTFLTSGGLGTMGYGLGAAIGAKIANPQKTVLHFAGDGSFRMNLNELATVSKYNLPIITILMNNGTLGMVRQWQTIFYEKRYSETDISNNIDYVSLAKSFGIDGKRATDIDAFKQVLQEAIKEKRPMVIECVIDKDESVYPFVPAGKAIDEMILETKK